MITSLLAVDDAPARILDIGAGTGDLAQALAGAFAGAEIGGIDVSSAGLELARAKVPGGHFVVRDLLESGEAPPELRGWATHAVCSEVLEHVDDPARLLGNAIPFLAAGCRLVVTVPGGPMSAFDRHIGHRRHYRPGELRMLLEAAGLEVEQASGAGFPFFNLYRLVVVLRGRRLIADAQGERPSGAARLTMRLFDRLFRLNLHSSPWGWQTIALARVPASQ